MTNKSFAQRFNTSPLSFDYELQEHHKYISLAQLEAKFGVDKTHKVRMIYINKHGHYGDSPCIVTDTHIINAPQHLMDSIKLILGDEKAIDDINKQLVGVKLYVYNNKYGKQLSLQWIDLVPHSTETEIPF